MTKARHVVLLRGINVGGKNKLPMKDLVAFFEAAGAESVRTYIQSGNVVFDCGAGDVPGVLASVRDAIAEEFGYDITLVHRAAEAWERIVAAHPFAAGAADPKHVHFGFLAEEPSPERVAELDPNRSPGDSFEVVGREVYFHVPGGLARTKLTSDYFDRRLKTVMTVRNWNTTNRILEMVRE